MAYLMAGARVPANARARPMPKKLERQLLRLAKSHGATLLTKVLAGSTTFQRDEMFSGTFRRRQCCWLDAHRAARAADCLVAKAMAYAHPPWLATAAKAEEIAATKTDLADMLRKYALYAQLIGEAQERLVALGA